jgi:2-methylcitrate dehydratase PrpD
LRADSAVLADALGIAGSSCAGLFAFLEDGAMGKHTHPGRASADGLAAAMFAIAGMAGPRTILESQDGFLQAYSDMPDSDIILNPLSGHLQILDTYHKIHSACGHAYPALDALFNLRQKVPNLAEQLIHLEVRVYKAAIGLKRSDVKSVTEARFSIPFLAGMAIELGSITSRDWCPEILKNADIRRLATLVEVVEDPVITDRFPAERCGEIVATLKDGRTIHQISDAPFGMPENPVNWSDMVDKFQISTQGILTEEDQLTVLDKIESLEDIHSTNEILNLLIPKFETSHEAT